MMFDEPVFDEPVFDEIGGADTATPCDIFSKDMNPNSTGSRMTENKVRHQSAETRQSVAAVTRAATTSERNLASPWGGHPNIPVACAAFCTRWPQVAVSISR